MRLCAALLVCLVVLLGTARVAPPARAQEEPLAIGDVAVVPTRRDLRVSPLADGAATRAPQVNQDLPTAQPGAPTAPPRPTIAAPSPVNVVVRDEMRTEALFWPRRCTTANNTGTYEEDGLRLRITGRCQGSSLSATIEAQQPDVTIGDGEARVEFRIERGWDRARVNVMLLDSGEGAAYLSGGIIAATGSVGLVALSPSGTSVLATEHVGESELRPDTWASLAIRRVGDRAWLLLNDKVVLTADGAPMNAGAPLPWLARNGSVEDGDEVVATFRNFTASTLERGDADRGVTRAPRPVVDPRYERILSFVRSDLVDDPGTDNAAAERRAIGRAIFEMIEATNVHLEVAPLQDMTAARFLAYRRVMEVDERLMTYTPYVATMLLLHEIVHAHQERIGQPSGCFEREVDAVKWQTRLWRAWFGPNGKIPPGDQIETNFTVRVRLENAGQLEQAVREVYREQCANA